MKYARHRSNLNKVPISKKRKWFGVLLIVLGLVFIIYAAFGIKRDVVEHDDDSDANSEATLELSTYSAADTDDYVEIELFAVDGSSSSGIARRGTSDDLFTHVVVADLPTIDTQIYFYEGWLVKPGVVEFFSTGEMFLREDGKWGLVWDTDLTSAQKDPFEYSKVVITLEDRDDNPAPSSTHVIEGEF